MMELYRRVAARFIEAALNVELAKAISEVLRSYVMEKVPGLDPHHDAVSGTGLRGMSDKSFSFPLRPKDFDLHNLNGNLIVKVDLSPAVSGHGPSIAGQHTRMEMEVGYYFKTPRLPGGGKYMFPTGAGYVDVEFDESGNPVFGDVPGLVDAVQKVTQTVLDQTPEGAKSLTRDPKERARLKDQADRAEEYAREQEQSKKREEQRTVDSSSHGSVDAFLQYMDQMEEDSFGPGDLEKLLSTMFRDSASRSISKEIIRRELVDSGLKWNPGKRHVSSMTPSQAAAYLNRVAAWVDSADQISLRDLRTRLALLIP